MTTDLATLATEALADDRVAPAAPWEMDIDDAETEQPNFTGKFYYGDGECSVCLYNDDERQAVALKWIAAARTREPLLAAGYLDLTRQLAEARAALSGLEAAAHRSRCDLLDCEQQLGVRTVEVEALSAKLQLRCEQHDNLCDEFANDQTERIKALEAEITALKARTKEFMFDALDHESDQVQMLKAGLREAIKIARTAWTLYPDEVAPDRDVWPHLDALAALVTK